MVDLRKLEQNLMDGMAKCQEITVENWGIATNLEEKTAKQTGFKTNLASSALTFVDLENQETLLHHLYKEFPTIEISVEEKINHPTDVQAEFYKNDGKSDYLVQLDPIDGTYGFREGIIKDYGIIASVVKRINPTLGKLISAIMYYPSLNFYIFANEEGFFKKKGMNLNKLSKSFFSAGTSQPYSSVFTHDQDRLGIFSKQKVHHPEIYSINQAVNQMVSGNVTGFLTSNGHTNDHVVGPWMMQKWGADVEYATGNKFEGIIPWGDVITKESRLTPRDNNGLLITGDKRDKYFQLYKTICGGK
jgi:3'-phosphoadenosine 5'-phosphosulfate (PAPS) 3'-phosphatase